MPALRRDNTVTEDPSVDRHCTHCHSALEFKGLKEFHEGNALHILMRKVACAVYVCRSCGHIEFFYPSEGNGPPLGADEGR